MNKDLEKILAGNGNARAIRVDIDALWEKALEERDEAKKESAYNPEEALDEMGEFAVISAWARGKGRKG